MKLSDLRYITQQDIDESHINITSAEMYKEFQDYNSHMLRMQQRKVRFWVDFYGMMAVDLLLIPVLCILTGKYTQITEPISDNVMFIVSTLLIGLFMGGGSGQLLVQTLGTFACAGFSFAAMGLVFLAIKKTVGLRVGRDEELRGLDIGEHGLEAYAGFQVFSNV